ncbi:MAG TPA: hypothetical protein VJ673_10680 [Aromatoleum sp.]|uniref:hypothetical protein n=1 Tax=Aromatoleum sp. TaxID=2307007 RepID=UPI002B4A194F|nr:hypothetical protein [Aromatoleum sp.]HJV26147.1 hypothetical protein [Aromatoleum sp.]
MTGCSVQTSTSENGKEAKAHIVWPEPPEQPRYIYEAQLRNQADIHKETDDEKMKRMLTGGTANFGEPLFRKPSAVAARNGRVYVADPPTNSIFVFDIPRGHVFQIGMREPNRTTNPVGLAVDRQNNVYVLDGKQKRVLVFDSLGLFLYAVGDPKALTKPAGVAVSSDGQRIFVVDRGSVEGDDHKVIGYSPDGAELFRIGPRGSGPGQLNIPLAATVTADGKLLVLDSGNFRIQGYDLNGTYKFTFGSLGNGLGQFSRARSIAVDQEGKIFVSDASFNNVQVFNPAGNLLMWIGSAGITNLPGNFGLIGGVAADETGRLYVADQYHRKIEVYRPADGTGQGNN